MGRLKPAPPYVTASADRGSFFSRLGLNLKKDAGEAGHVSSKFEVRSEL